MLRHIRDFSARSNSSHNLFIVYCSQQPVHTTPTKSHHLPRAGSVISSQIKSNQIKSMSSHSIPFVNKGHPLRRAGLLSSLRRRRWTTCRHRLGLLTVRRDRRAKYLHLNRFQSIRQHSHPSTRRGNFFFFTYFIKVLTKEGKERKEGEKGKGMGKRDHSFILTGPMHNCSSLKFSHPPQSTSDVAVTTPGSSYAVFVPASPLAPPTGPQMRWVAVQGVCAMLWDFSFVL